MNPKVLRVITPNKMIFIKGKLIRSPFKSIVTSESQLNLLEASLKNLDVNYTIRDYKKEEPVKAVKKPVEEKPVEKKTKKSEPKSTLEKIASDIE